MSKECISKNSSFASFFESAIASLPYLNLHPFKIEISIFFFVSLATIPNFNQTTEKEYDFGLSYFGYVSTLHN